MRADSQVILDSLDRVERERQTRLANPKLLVRVNTLKRYQQQRFCHTYADLLASSRYGPASQFFLEELYGPDDFTQRDAEFARVVPALARLFPEDVVETIKALSELHAISEMLDTAMARNLDSSHIAASTYVHAWQATGCAADRENQIRLILTVSDRLDGFTRSLFMRNSLRLMRHPAQAAGLGKLQRFLEDGFDAFKSMKGAAEFIDLIQQREQAMSASLFSTILPNASGVREDSIEFPMLPPENSPELK